MLSTSLLYLGRRAPQQPHTPGMARRETREHSSQARRRRPGNQARGLVRIQGHAGNIEVPLLEGRVSSFPRVGIPHHFCAFQNTCPLSSRRLLGVAHSVMCKNDASRPAPGHGARPRRSIWRGEALGWDAGATPVHSTVTCTRTHTHAAKPRQDYETASRRSGACRGPRRRAQLVEWQLFPCCPLTCSPLLSSPAPPSSLPLSLQGPFPL